jgi:16S rRNA (guanine966-N2)-methyltransferase
MRVIGGTKRGFRLASPVGMRVRPTSDRVREALFNVLQPYVTDATVLDLFAGTGAVGIEALSRGATKAVFVDSHPRSTAVIQKNLSHCGFAALGNIITKDVLVFLRHWANQIAQPFTLIFMDPPYAWDKTVELLQLIGPEILVPEGLVVVEHAFGTDLPSEVNQLVRTSDRRYGDTELVFYCYRQKGRS